MAGRGRGKTNGTLTQEQLQSLGVTSKEMQTVTSAAPPPLYPALLAKPVPLEVRLVAQDRRETKFLLHIPHSP